MDSDCSGAKKKRESLQKKITEAEQEFKKVEEEALELLTNYEAGKKEKASKSEELQQAEANLSELRKVVDASSSVQVDFELQIKDCNELQAKSQHSAEHITKEINSLISSLKKFFYGSYTSKAY